MGSVKGSKLCGKNKLLSLKLVDWAYYGRNFMRLRFRMPFIHIKYAIGCSSLEMDGYWIPKVHAVLEQKWYLVLRSSFMGNLHNGWNPLAWDGVEFGICWSSWTWAENEKTGILSPWCVSKLIFFKFWVVVCCAVFLEFSWLTKALW